MTAMTNREQHECEIELGRRLPLQYARAYLVITTTLRTILEERGFLGKAPKTKILSPMGQGKISAGEARRIVKQLKAKDEKRKGRK